MWLAAIAARPPSEDRPSSTSTHTTRSTMAARSGDVSAATTLSRRADTWAVLRVLTTDHSRCHPAGLRSRSRRDSSMIRSELRILALGSAARLISAIRDRASISLCCGNMVELLANKGFDEHDCEEHELEQPQEVVRGWCSTTPSNMRQP